MVSMDVDRNLYDGIFYCGVCDTPMFFHNILKGDPCTGCGHHAFMSHIHFNIWELSKFYEELTEDWA